MKEQASKNIRLVLFAFAFGLAGLAVTGGAPAQDAQSPDVLVTQLIENETDPVLVNYAPLAFSGEAGNGARQILAEWIRTTSCDAPPGSTSCQGRPIIAPSCEWKAINLGWGAAHRAEDINAYQLALANARSWLAVQEAALADELETHEALDPGWPQQVMRMRTRDQFWRRLRIELGNDASLEAGTERSIRDYMARVRMCSADEQSAAYVSEVFELEGWPRISRYGEEIDESFWLLVQHAPLSIQEAVLPELERLYPLGETRPRNFGMLYDRVRQRNGQPQRYGTQYSCVHGVPQLYQVEDEEALNSHRAALGMPSIEEAMARRC